MRSIKVGIFLTLFFNTGILLMISGANLSETSVPLLKEIFKGPYTDFNYAWFKEVGPLIVKTMLIGAFMPLIEILINWSLLKVMRIMDAGCSKDKFKTANKSI